MATFDKIKGISVASNFKLQAETPLDGRLVVDTIADRDALITEHGAYEGITVYVKADKKKYILTDLSNAVWICEQDIVSEVFKDLRKEIDERKTADVALKDEVQAVMADFGNSIIADITIPTNSWTQQETDAQGYIYYADVSVATAKENHFPNVALAKESHSVAAAARICPSVQAGNGTLRFWAKLIPDSEIKATAALLKSSSDASGGSGGGNYVLPTATKTRLGGVKIGDNITVQPDGTISSSGKLDPSQVVTDDEAKQMLDEIFNKKD